MASASVPANSPSTLGHGFLILQPLDLFAESSRSLITYLKSFLCEPDVPCIPVDAAALGHAGNGRSCLWLDAPGLLHGLNQLFLMTRIPPACQLGPSTMMTLRDGEEPHPVPLARRASSRLGPG